MKKLLILSATAAAMMLATVSTSSAQVIKGFYKQSYKTRNNGTFDKGTNLFSVGLGVPYAYVGYKTTLPSIYVKYEYGIMNEVGIGLVGGLGAGKYSFNDKGYLSTNIGVLGYYHFNKIIPVKKLDVYLGAGVGFDINNRNALAESNVDVLPLAKAGARWYFSPGFGVYVESGYDKLSTANLGVSFRF